MFITDAMAEGAAASPQGGIIQLVLMVGMFFVIMYFMIFRPQQKRAKDHKALMESIGKGDEVTISGGIVGKITKIDDNYVVIKTAGTTELQVQRQSVTNVLPKGTLKKST